MKIEDFFVSEKFNNLLMPLFGRIKKDKIFDVVEFIISSSISFGSLNDFSVDKIEEYITKLVERFCNDPNEEFKYAYSPIIVYSKKLAFDLTLNNLGYSNDDLHNFDIEKKVFKYFIEKLRINTYIYHAFNSTFYSSILDNGINPNINFTEQDTLNEIDSLFEKYGCKMILGWQKLNCVGKVSYSQSPNVSYSYGIRSPEWFSEFCGGSLNFADIPDRCIDAFSRNDYESAKNNLIQLMDKYKFNLDDCDRVLHFFDENWIRYANKESYVAVIPYKRENNDVDYLYKRFTSLGTDISQFFDVFYADGNVDEHTDKVIDVVDAKFIKLPDYNCLEKKLSNDDIMGKIQILRDAVISFKDVNGKKEMISMHSEYELRLVKEILSDNDVYKTIISGNDLYLCSWIPYFNLSIINDDDNVISLYKNHSVFFPYVSEEKRNDVNLMKKCISGDKVDKQILYLVGESVLNDMEFISLLLIKLDDNEFDFYIPGADSIDGSRMAYGKIFGKKVLTNQNFWELLNSKIKLLNKKYGLAIPLFDSSKEMVIASRYFDEIKGKN